MPRPRIRRRIRFSPKSEYFKPRNVPLRELNEIVLDMDEIEAMRLKDFEKLNQASSAKKMNISTSTFQRILESGHYKTVDALTQGKAIKIRRGVMDMAGFDKTGPDGEGPMTGRGDGDCVPEEGSKSRPRVGLGQRVGRGVGRGLARGVGRANRRSTSQRVGRGRANVA